MIRDYVKGAHETLDVTIVNAGSGKNSIKADGMFNNAFYDLAFYSDSGYTVPISASSYESSTIDAYYTGEEGFNIYSEYRILDPTYQTGTIYARFESIGIYTSGEAVGVDIINIDDNYAYTTNPYAYKEIIIADGLSADITITVTDGGSDRRNRAEIVNNDSTYKVIVTDSTYTYWCLPSEKFEIYVNESGDINRSAGRGRVYYDLANVSTVPDTSLISGVSDNDVFEMRGANGANTQSFSAILRIFSKSASLAISGNCSSGAGDARFVWNNALSTFTNNDANVYVKEIYKIYD